MQRAGSPDLWRPAFSIFHKLMTTGCLKAKPINLGIRKRDVERKMEE